jgi:hypothetical protein
MVALFVKKYVSETGMREQEQVPRYGKSRSAPSITVSLKIATLVPVPDEEIFWGIRAGVTSQVIADVDVKLAIANCFIQLPGNIESMVSNSLAPLDDSQIRFE